jgi:hypothetical protein
MNKQLIFLSHIHEERDLAILLKNAIEMEFSGFIDVFVSSDGVSIPAGSNFLNRIESGLVNCVGAVYLLSPNSIKRSWINFELGAVWIRNILSVKSGGVEIPALPFCHSGITPGSLPQPISNLNGIEANKSSMLEFAFKSLQTAVGGSGPLRTDFDQLAVSVREFENKYTIQDNLSALFNLLNFNKEMSLRVLNNIKNSTGNSELVFQDTENTVADAVRDIVNNKLSSIVNYSTSGGKLLMTTSRSINALDVKLIIDSEILRTYLPVLFP